MLRVSYKHPKDSTLTSPKFSVRMAVVAGLVAGSATMLMTSTVGASAIRLASETGDTTTTTTVAEDTTTTTVSDDTTTTTLADDTTTSTTVFDDTTTTTVADATTSTTAAPIGSETKTVDVAGAGSVTVSRDGKVLTLNDYSAAAGYTVWVKQERSNQVKIEFTNGTKRVKVHAHVVDGALRIDVKPTGQGKSSEKKTSVDTASSVASKSGKGKGKGRGGE